MKKKRCTSIGGQAVIEGVMMRGERSMATAVRDEKGNIVVESRYIRPTREKNILFRAPFLRGIFSFLGTMMMGMGTLMRSGEVFDGETQPSKAEAWMSKKLGIDVYQIIMAIAVILGIALSFGLFYFLPQIITSGIVKWTKIDPNAHYGVKIGLNFLEGAIRILIFVGYIALTCLMKDVRRTYMYHGAEHKTISCYEHGLDLTVENVQKMSTVHDRCGTTFMFLVMVVSVLIFSLSGWTEYWWANLLIRLALLPVVMGVSYEILKFLAKFDNVFVRILKAPGLLLQKLTTKQPTDDMVEVAITAFQTVLAMDADPNLQEQFFDTKIPFRKARERVTAVLSAVPDVSADDDWIWCEVLDIPRSELESQSHVLLSQQKRALAYAKERATGKPLWQIFGYADFYGYKIRIDENVLIPRPETEYLVEQAVAIARKSDAPRVLDLCTGSGCIAVAIGMQCDKAHLTAADISEQALQVAKENLAHYLPEDRWEIVQSDMFAQLPDAYDIIVCNPPYIPHADIDTLQSEVRDHEPHLALDGGADGLDYYRILAKQAPAHLHANGAVCCEVGIGQADTVAQLLEQAGMRMQIYPDLEGVSRIVIGYKEQA